MLARAPDGTHALRKLRNCGIVALDPRLSDRLQGPDVLEVGAAVEVREAGEAELDEPLRRELAARSAQLRRDAVDEGIEVVAGDRPLVGCAGERGTELRGLEALAFAAPLPDPEPLGDHALIRREAMAALRASPAPPNGDSVIGGAGLRDAGLGAAEGADHAMKYSLDIANQ
jgi:hypothetical protein